MLLRLSSLDSDAESAVRVIGFFDALVTGRADLTNLLKSAAELAECPGRGLVLRAEPGGKIDLAGPPAEPRSASTPTRSSGSPGKARNCRSTRSSWNASLWRDRSSSTAPSAACLRWTTRRWSSSSSPAQLVSQNAPEPSTCSASHPRPTSAWSSPTRPTTVDSPKSANSRSLWSTRSSSSLPTGVCSASAQHCLASAHQSPGSKPVRCSNSPQPSNP